LFATGGEETRANFKRQADADADTFLRLRALEFAPGGLLFLVLPSRMGDLSCSTGLYQPIHDAAAELAAKAEIDTSLLEDLVMPSYIYEVEVRSSQRLLHNSPCTVLACGFPCRKLKGRHMHAPFFLKDSPVQSFSGCVSMRQHLFSVCTKGTNPCLCPTAP